MLTVYVVLVDIMSLCLSCHHHLNVPLKVYVVIHACCCYESAGVMEFSFILIATNLFGLLKFTENSKEIRSDTSSTCCLISHFGMNVAIFHAYVFASMHVLNFMF